MVSIPTLYSLFLKYPHIVTDSRKATENTLFFGLKGPSFDGNSFADQAVENGAAFAIIDNPAYKKNDSFILVDNVLETLQNLATYHRMQLDLPVIAITGSNGKTTTKELIKAVLGDHYKTHATTGNLNNHIGVPLTLLSMHPDTQMAIVEMGANHPGEIAFLCEIARPTHGLITNIGKAHLEGFGSLEGVKKTKAELYQYLADNNGVAFVNTDEQWLKSLVERVERKVYYRQALEFDDEKDAFFVRCIENYPFVKVAFMDDRDMVFEVESQLVGKYNFNNIMTAVVLGIYFKVPALKIKKGIESYAPSNNRSQLLERGSNTYFMDAYNANPTSMKAALDNLAGFKSKHKIAVLGDMLELGAYATKAHQEITDYALSLQLDKLILVGPLFRACAENTAALYFDSVDELKKWLDKQVFSDTTFLVKGSRGMKLENILA